MSKTVRIKQGADIRLAGQPSPDCSQASVPKLYAVQPTDFPGVTPKLAVKEGASVKAGEPLFYDKTYTSVQFVSPVSGVVKEVIRGAKRRILAVVVESDGNAEAVNHGAWNGGSREDLLNHLCASGVFATMRQRPFDVLANPADTPRAIYVSGFDSSPLAAETAVAVAGRLEDVQRGLTALSELAGSGGVHVGVKAGDATLASLTGVTLTSFSGPHPSGNVGVQIHHTAPINKGEVLWTMGLQDVANLGALLATGVYTPSRVVALGGSEMHNPRHVKTLAGAQLSGLGFQVNEGARVISGSVLTGTNSGMAGYLGAMATQVVALPEGHDPKFLLTSGWLSPGLDKFSLSRAYPTWLLPKSKRWKLDTNQNGEDRAFVVTGQYEQVFPFDIYPVHLVKSIMVNDIDAMERLGIYEVAPEDFALCEYVCTSKIPVQSVIREGLDMLKTELG
jgi:Na+-transporting NADH:ubiquinone oxidoreductase subunit A